MNKKLYVGLLAVTILSVGIGCAERAPSPTPHQESSQTPSLQEMPFVAGQPAPMPPAGFAWCLETRPAVTRSVNEQVIIRPATSYLEAVPAQFEGRTERVMVEPERHNTVVVKQAVYRDVSEQRLSSAANVEYRTIPAQYQWVEEETEVVPERTEKCFIPARYEERSERILVQPAHTVRESVLGCDRETKMDCYASRTVPAEYTTVIRKQEVVPATTQLRVIPAVNKTMRVRKLVAAARVEKVDVPAQYVSVTKKVLDRPAEYREDTQPARYNTIEKKVQVAPESQRVVRLPTKYGTVCRVEVISPERLVWVLKENHKLSCVL